MIINRLHIFSEIATDFTEGWIAHILGSIPERDLELILKNMKGDDLNVKFKINNVEIDIKTLIKVLNDDFEEQYKDQNNCIRREAEVLIKEKLKPYNEYIEKVNELGYMAGQLEEEIRTFMYNK